MTYKGWPYKLVAFTKRNGKENFGGFISLEACIEQAKTTFSVTDPDFVTHFKVYNGRSIAAVITRD